MMLHANDPETMELRNKIEMLIKYYSVEIVDLDNIPFASNQYRDHYLAGTKDSLNRIVEDLKDVLE